MRANLSFGDQLELSLRAQLELARGDLVTEGACTDYRCAVKIIPAWVGILTLMAMDGPWQIILLTFTASSNSISAFTWLYFFRLSENLLSRNDNNV